MDDAIAAAAPAAASIHLPPAPAPVRDRSRSRERLEGKLRRLRMAADSIKAMAHAFYDRADFIRRDITMTRIGARPLQEAADELSTQEGELLGLSAQLLCMARTADAVTDNLS